MCTICKQESPARKNNMYFPFCSERCQLIDLGRWLDGEYRIAGESVEATSDDARK